MNAQHETTSPAEQLSVFVESNGRSAIATFGTIGTDSEARLEIRDILSGLPISTLDVRNNKCITIDLEKIDFRRGVEVSLQRLSEGKWHDLPDNIVPIASPVSKIAVLRPSDWGVEQDCWASIQESQSRELLLQRRIKRGGLAYWARDHGTSSRYTLQFREISPHDNTPGPIIGNTHRWVPEELRGKFPASARTEDDGLAYTVRENVVLAPGVRGRHGRGAHVSTGYIGAWEGKDPIPEALLSVLGRQYTDFLPYASPSMSVTTPVIYLGAPQYGWGHFLTQGLSRIWYALSNPQVPVVWDATSLSNYQREILDLIGLKNEQLFLKSPTRFSEVIFPLPGICIGDYVDPAYVRRIGRHEGAATVKGRKVLLSRSKLGAKAEVGSNQSDALDDLANDYGFDIVYPERLSVREQLDLLSSSEVVLGIEGSAMHTPLLLRGTLNTRFFALTRHRAGSGVFEHLRNAKDLNYETLNFRKEKGLSGAREGLALDFTSMRTAFDATEGLEVNYAALEPFRERPARHETPYSALVPQFQCSMPPQEEAIKRIHLGLLSGKRSPVASQVAAML